jgi:predicted NBD/HSP70 family sugar kinase
MDFLQGKTRLSYPSINKMVNELLREGIIIKDGFYRPEVGKPASCLSLTKNYYAIGIDVEIPDIRFIASDLYGRELVSEKRSLLNPTCDEVIDILINIITGMVESELLVEKKCIGIGIGLPGTIDESEKKSLKIERIKGWKNIDIAGILQTKFQVPVYIKNDVHLIAMLEHNRKELDSFAHIAIRQGIGMAIFINDELLSGKLGNAGFLGHTTIIPGGLLCKCGCRGCLECYASKKAIEDDYFKESKIKKRITIDKICEYAALKDQAAVSILKKSGHYLGIAIANVYKLFDVHHFSISGLCGEGSQIMIEECLKTAKKNIANMMINDVQISLSNINEAEFALGGCLYVIEVYFQKPNLKLSDTNLSLHNSGLKEK